MFFFKAIPIETILVNKKTVVDLYIKTNKKLIQYLPQDTLFTEHHFSHLSNREITHLYVRRKDKNLIEQHTAEHLEDVLTNPHIPSNIKSHVFYTSSSYIMRKIVEDPRTDYITDLKKSVKLLIENIVRNEVVMNDLFTITNHDYTTYIHSVNVGIFATVMALKYYGPHDPNNNLSKLSYGFFLHDIGKSKVPLEILNKPALLNEQEWEILKKHPQWGYNILMETGHLTDEAAYIALEHHEKHDGSGYPYGIRGNEIHPCARICAVVDTFDALTTERPYRVALSAFEALRYMQKVLIYEFDYDCLTTFIKLLGPKNNKTTRIPIKTIRNPGIQLPSFTTSK